MNGKRGTEIGKEYRKQDEKANSAPPVALAVCGVDAMGGRRFSLSERADRIPSHRMREGAQKIVCGCRSRRTQRGKQALKTEKTNAVRFFGLRLFLCESHPVRRVAVKRVQAFFGARRSFQALSQNRREGDGRRKAADSVSALSARAAWENAYAAKSKHESAKGKVNGTGAKKTDRSIRFLVVNRGDRAFDRRVHSLFSAFCGTNRSFRRI